MTVLCLVDVHTCSATTPWKGGERGQADLSRPAQATMMPLSVHRLGAGHTSFRPASCATLERFSLTRLFAATPPATTRCCRPGRSSLAHAAARLHLAARCSTATFWKEAAMSALTCDEQETGNISGDLTERFKIQTQMVRVYHPAGWPESTLCCRVLDVAHFTL